MRLLGFTLFVLCCTSCQHAREVRISRPDQAAAHSPAGSDSRWLFESQFDTTKYDFVISDPLLHKASRWMVEKERLPLIPERAESAAIEQAHKLAPGVNHWWVDNVVLRRVDDECWYYEVLLLRGDVVIMGLPPENYFLKIPVLMNGAAVPPVSSN